MSESDTSPEPEDEPHTTETESNEQTVVDPGEEVDGETPLVVVPRGGGREVGRSCYQVETINGTYLVDCGLNQGDGGQFPDFRGLAPESIDAVFITHAHIDHTGALPVLEHRGLLKPDAKIVCTQPTAALAHTLLHDSLKIHQEEAKKPGRRERFTREDVENVLSRFTPIDGYKSGPVTDHVDIPHGDLRYKFGNAGHLLGSAWLALESGGRRVVFSGDLGGRSAHLPDIEDPPSADTLFLESTYGETNTHPSFSDARTDLFEEAIDAVEQGIPVLIPTFAVGRAQEILQIFRERWRDLPSELQDTLEIVYDGMATEATDRYHAFASPEYISENIFNYMQNAADFEPFIPEIAYRPTDGFERAGVLTGDNAPIIVAPSGMLTGGLSPAYLLGLVENYEEARVIFTGYQAEGTTGRELQQASGDTVTTTVNAWPIRDPDKISDGDESNDETGESEGDESTSRDGPPRREITVPTRWVRTINGMSGHAARNTLLQFARQVDANHIALIHGEPRSQRSMSEFIESNTEADVITQATMQTPIPVHPPGEGIVATQESLGAAHPGLTVRREENVDEDQKVTSTQLKTSRGSTDGEGSDYEECVDEEAREVLEQVTDRIGAIDGELTALRNNDKRSEEEIRSIVRDEVLSVLSDVDIDINSDF